MVLSPGFALPRAIIASANRRGSFTTSASSKPSFPFAALAMAITPADISVPMVEGRGQCAMRGAIVDVFPANAADALRIEFFDDEIDSLRRFDCISQRSIARVKGARIAPATECLVSDAEAAAEKVTDRAGAAAEKMAEHAGQIADAVTDHTETAAEHLADAAGLAAQKVAEAADAAAEGVEYAARHTADTIQAVVEELEKDR